MSRGEPAGGDLRGQRDVEARSDARVAASAARAEDAVSSSMLRLGAMKRHGELPYKTADGRIDISRTLQSMNPLIEALAILAHDPDKPEDVVKRVVPMVGAVELLGSSLREVHTAAATDGVPQDDVSITKRYATVVHDTLETSRRLIRDHDQAFSDWSRDHNAPELAPAELETRLAAVESALNVEHQSPS
jgi:hypothetical protein